MCPIKGRRPITEIVEAAQNELVREAAAGQENKYFGFANQVYLNDLPSVLPERYVKKKAFITTAADYTTGTVTVGTGTTGVKGASTSWTSTYNNYWILVSGADTMYRVTYSADTLLTLNNSITWTGSSGAGLSYTLFQDRYALPLDFAYLAEDQENEPQNVYKWINNSKIFLRPQSNFTYDRNFTGVIGELYAYTVKWESEGSYIYVASAPDVAENLGYEYMPEFNTLTEYTTGTLTITAATVASGVGTVWSGIDSTNTYYLRNDADGTGSGSKWTKITSFDSDTKITLSSSYSYTTGTGLTYTISEISKWPARFDDAIMYRTSALVDPDGVQAEKWAGFYNNAVNLDLTVETKRRRSQRAKKFFGLRNNRKSRGVNGL